MSVSIKAIFAVSALLSVGGIGIWALSSKGMPEWSSLAQDSEFWNGNTVNTIYKDKYGEKHARFLVGVETDKEEGGSTKDNKTWWNWSFEKRYKSKDVDFTNEFESGIDSGEKLREVCKSVYGGTLSDDKKIQVSSSDGSLKKYSEKYVWLFCSPLGAKPVLLKESDSLILESEYIDTKDSNAKWGQASDVHGELISTYSDKNDLFWEIQQRDLGWMNIKEEHKFFSAKIALDVRNICGRAYATLKPSSGTTSSKEAPSKDEILRYCSISLQVTAPSSLS